MTQIQSDPYPDVSVAIVHYRTPDLLQRCLEALAAGSDGLRIEVYVVDNASPGFAAADVERTYPGAHVIANDRNLGFAAASNQALRAGGGRYRLLLNPDAFVAPETLGIMVRYMDDHPDVGCATARVELEDGRLDLACRRLFPTPIRSFYRMTLLSKLFPRSRRFGQYNLTYLDEWQETEIDQPCGAFMLVRDAVVQEVGLLDEGYFMYGEDTDWAFRMKAAGWRIRYVPRTTVRHIKRASSRSYRQQTIRYFYDAMRRFYRQHYAADYPVWVTATILAAITVRERIELTADRLTGLWGGARRV